MAEHPPHPWLKLDHRDATARIERFLARHVEQASAGRVVVGVSGGLDSATTLALAARALDPDSVDAIFLPGPTSPDEDEAMARNAAEAAGVEVDVAQIGPALEALEPELGVDADRTVRGNLQARLRMCVLYARANAGRGLVLGTGNRSELSTGYFTKHGDGAADLLPLGDLYKTQERLVAREVGVPEEVVQRPPTAGLWEGQRDEDELGLPYADLDVILAGFDRDIDDEHVADEADVETDEVERVRKLVRATEHKRRSPPVARVREGT